ncbi:NUDIX hydrolase N-terminal domain-containing protein [Francisella philomiragia]|uniref:MutT/NUDIX family protein n=1 Tax=Francisella philomiragia subsp. philomiragia (strain ATCC 25017 / CCUG 19701 / FSC 153 / O\|nr:NUDIX hydrolase N-terminal domain-containing protein [Francisella philomiragia]AJI47782.1 NUDIX domain protein [Francisella philomiragia]AJI48335.1 NUDIX domain protein [Francisella philomiragia]AJI74235.1 NUDIX domain protein [Francisella philomiragia subsp. philomiragia ATCC 25015]EET20265.1 MutT protein [Francisella philomiragia subsp. philomiragia ATCC 25015]MBK2021319.1 NUDIX hydrolase N-terminal domain-containing protein [Francisella philomiragia]
MHKDKIFEFIKKVQAISHTGVVYSKCPYALDNYHELLELSSKMLHEYIKSDVQPYDIYRDMYYPTPQPGVRVVIFQNNKLLMAEDADTPNEWTIPGGWCDIDLSPVETCIKEVKEETGYDIKVTKFLALMDRNNYTQSEIYNVYSLVFVAEIVGGENSPNFEVNKVDFFDINELPKLSHKLTKEELDIILKTYKDNTVYFE